jgi:ribosomal protein S15P/S13E
MPFTPDELAALAVEAAELAQFLNDAFRKDEEGKVRLSKAESKMLFRRLSRLALHLGRDFTD